MQCEQYVFVINVLLISTFLQFVSCNNNPTSSHCGEELTNVDTGSISPPISYLDPVTCLWVVSAPPGSKLLVKVEKIELSNEADELFVSIDGEELVLPRNCEQCSMNITAEVLNVTYRFKIIDNENDNVERSHQEDQDLPVMTEGNGTNSMYFRITYESFDPEACSTPIAPENGYVMGKNKAVGSKIQYRCSDPYEVLGAFGATCVIGDDSPIPWWDPPEPWCIIPSCNGTLQNKTAGRGIGIIVHPGYPRKMILSSQHCLWQIRSVSPNRRIMLNIKSFNLPTNKKKKGFSATSLTTSSSFLDVFDSSRDNLIVRLQNQETPRTFVTSSDLLILELQTSNVSMKGNDAGGSLGFYIEYTVTCEVVGDLEHGSVNFSGKNVPFGIGSSMNFRCDYGFELVGNSTVSCVQGTNWDGVKPFCKSVDDVGLIPVKNAGKKVGLEMTTADSGSVFVSPKMGNKKDSSSLHQNAGSKTVNEKPDKNEEPSKTFSQSHKTNDGSNPTFDENQREENKREFDSPDSTARGDVNDISTLTIIIGIAVPIVVLSFLIFGGYIWYRRQYPVRMGLGRKFETFENPAYDRKKGKMCGNPDFPDEPAELQKLTSLPSP